MTAEKSSKKIISEVNYLESKRASIDQKVIKMGRPEEKFQMETSIFFFWHSFISITINLTEEATEWFKITTDEAGTSTFYNIT